MLGPLFQLMAPLDPVWQGVLWGLPVGLIALLIYRVASNQADIARTKNGIKANLLALRLFRDDLGVVLRTQGQIFRLVGRYLRLGLVPLAILLIPVVLLLIQIESRFAYQTMAVGKPALLVVTVDSSLETSAVEVDLTASKGMRVETPAFRMDSEKRILWRISPAEPGLHSVRIRLDDREVVRQLWAGDERPELLVQSIYRSGDIRSFGSPGEATIDSDSAVASISVEYAPSEDLFAGLSPASWAMFVSSLVFGFALRRPLGVVF
jgi:hypothetical protein